MQVEKALHTHRYEHIKLKNLKLAGLQEYIGEEKARTQRGKTTSYNFKYLQMTCSFRK